MRLYMAVSLAGIAFEPRCQKPICIRYVSPRKLSLTLEIGRWLGSRVVSVLDSGAEGPGFKSQPRHCRVTVLDKLFTPIVPLFTKQQHW